MLLQNFKPVPYPKGDYGKFYTGDSYIILYVSIEKYSDFGHHNKHNNIHRPKRKTEYSAGIFTFGWAKKQVK